MRDKPLLIKLTQAEHESVRSEAAKLGISMADFIRLLFRQWVDGITFQQKDNNNGKAS